MTSKNVVEEAVAKAKGKADAGEVPAQAPEGEATEAKAPAAPRPRKWDYGIAPAAKLSVNKEKMPDLHEDKTYHIGKGLDTPYNLIAESCKGNKKGVTVNDFDATDGCTRSHIRKLARSGRIIITGENGDVFPKEYVKPEPKPKAEKPAKEAA